MDEYRLEHVIALFEQALSIPREHRPEFLRHVSGDNAALRQELGSLLDAQESAAEYFDDLAERVVSPGYAALVAASTVGPRWEGRRVGPYRLVREIGRGGMSRVFLAERADGEFEQQVALKLLRPGFDSDIDVMRFRAERQILASLNHPNIARLLDGGVTDDALPYLVLEYIDGVPVDRYCHARGLSTRQRLDLFLTIADAVEYAHRSAVVHRDLKPSNILVTSDGAVKLLDFGVAKLLEQAPGARPTTRTTHRWMTPDYAAPEQIRGKPITPRTDVYQLGAALYELLVGRTPFGHCGETIHELERAVLEREPDSLGRELRGDLDAIVLKALRKNPDERYASASEFADDVRRHLTGHTVHARRRTLGYRTRRFVHRNRLRLAAAAAVAVLLVTSAIAVSVEAARSRRALAELLSRVDIAEPLPTFVNDLLTLSSAETVADTAAARGLVEKGVTYARRASRQPQRRAQVLEAAGTVQVKLHAYDSAFSLLQEAVVIRRRLVDSRRAADQRRASGSSMPPVASDPMRRKLLFTRPPGTVFMVDADGSHEARITDPNENNDAPAWAPDGRRVLLAHFGGAAGIYIVNPDGTDLTQVTAPPRGWVDDGALALGNGIVFVRTDTLAHERRGIIYRINVDGTGLTRLTFGPRADEDHAAPSPNGDFIVFRRDGDIWRRDLRQGTETRLTNTPTQYKGVAGVSPDGRKILFTRIDPGRLEQIFVMNVDGTGVRRVSRGDYYDFLPRWSPDGTRIAFTSSRDGTNGVYTMNANGSDVRDVSRTPLTLAMRPGIGVMQVNESLWAWR